MKMKYPNTNIYPQIGDVVKFNGDDSIMIIEDVINTKEKRDEWGVEEDLIMMKGDKYGLISDHLDENSDVIFIRRKGI